MINSADIRNAPFTRAGRNYRAIEVDDFLDSVADSFDLIQKENDELIRKLEILADKIQEYRQDEDSIRNALLTAQRMGDQILKEANEKSETSLNESKTRADALLTQAKQKSDEMMAQTEEKSIQIISDTRNRAGAVLSEAKEKAANMLTDAQKNAAAESNVYQKIKAENARFKSRLLAIYKTHVELINQLPDETAPSFPYTAHSAASAAEPVASPMDELSDDTRQIDDYLTADTISQEPSAYATSQSVSATPLVQEEETQPLKDAIYIHSGQTQKDADAPVPEQTQTVQNVVTDSGSTTPVHGFQVTVEDDPPVENKQFKFGDLKFGENYNISEDNDENNPDLYADKGFFKRRKK